LSLINHYLRSVGDEVNVLNDHLRSDRHDAA